MVLSNSDKHARTKKFIERWCDNLDVADVDWGTASDPTPTYNCMGFAVGVLRYWQPPDFIDGVLASPGHFWPADIPTDWSVDTYALAAMTVGFTPADDTAWSDGFEMIALYFDEKNREFTHAAKLVSPGVWASKLGDLSDIEHPVKGVDSVRYGKGRIFLKRPRMNG